MSSAIPEPRLLDSLRATIRLKGYSRSTEKTYCHWVRQYVLYHDKQHPRALGAKDVENFLSALVSTRHASASTQNQALSALLFLYKHVIGRPIETPIKALKAKKYEHIPSVLSVDEVRKLLSCMTGVPKLMAELTYGSGMRVSEVSGLRVQDLDFVNKRIVVRDGKGRKDRFTLLPVSLIEQLQSHLIKVKQLHISDLAKGYGASVLPGAYAKRMSTASKEFIWQFVFPSNSIFHDEHTDLSGRWHVHRSTLQRAVRTAAHQAGLQKRASIHTLRHCFATHLLQAGCDVRQIQVLLGHSHINTTMIYAHIVDAYQLAVVSPLDRFPATDGGAQQFIQADAASRLGLT